MTNDPNSEYSFGYDEGMLDYQTYRAIKSLDFIAPYLKPAVSVLECGSGPAAVTFQIAKKIPDGTVLGIDINESLVNANNDRAKEQGMDNLSFETQNMLDLPYDDNSFDLVYMQAVLVHVPDPPKALSECRRVLKDGGRILAKEPIMDRAYISPENPLFIESFELIQKTIKSYGGDSSIGRKLWPLLEVAGFKDIFISSSWEQPESLSERQALYESWISAMEGQVGAIVLMNGWADKGKLEEIGKAWTEFARSNKGYAGSPWGQAAAVK